MRVMPLGYRSRVGKIERRPVPPAGQDPPENLVRPSAGADEREVTNSQSSCLKRSDQGSPVPLESLVSSKFSQNTQLTSKKKVRFSLPNMEIDTHRTNMVNHRKMDRAWKTWKRRRENILIMTLSLKQRNKAYPSCLASITINDYCLTVLVDTGASKSVLDFDVWKRISVPGAKLAAADLPLFGASGTPLSMYGAVDLTLEIQSCKYSQRFQVVDIGQQSVSGILGLDFLIAVAAKIDLGNMTLTIGKRPVPGLVGKQSTVYAVMLEGNLVCEGYTANLAKCT